MGKCLFTKLNSFVDNDDLEKFGELKFTITNGGSCKIGRLPGSSPTYISSVNNSSYDNVLLNETINAHSCQEYVAAGTTTFSISYKYNISVFNTNTDLINFDINEWLKLNSLTFVCCLKNASSVTGDLKQLFNEYAKLYPNHNTITIMVDGAGITNIPRGISNVWNVYSQLIFNPSYKDGWYTFDGDSHYYNSDGEEITP